MSTVPAVLSGETERTYLVRLGLAKPSRGRLSAAAHEALLVARLTYGEVFAVVEKPTPAPRPVVQSAPAPAAAPRPQVAPVEKSESKIIRAWAKTQDGLTVGDRGRLHPDVIAAYRDAHGDSPVTQVEVRRPTPLDMPRRTEVRGLWGTGRTDAHVQDICGNLSCGRSISRCQCQNGPQALGGVTGTLRLV